MLNMRNMHETCLLSPIINQTAGMETADSTSRYSDRLR